MKFELLSNSVGWQSVFILLVEGIDDVLLIASLTNVAFCGSVKGFLAQESFDDRISSLHSFPHRR